MKVGVLAALPEARIPFTGAPRAVARGAEHGVRQIADPGEAEGEGVKGASCEIGDAGAVHSSPSRMSVRRWRICRAFASSRSCSCIRATCANQASRVSGCTLQRKGAP